MNKYKIMQEIKLKRINDLVVIVSNVIQTINLSVDNQEEEYSYLENLINKINSNLTDDKLRNLYLKELSDIIDGNKVKNLNNHLTSEFKDKHINSALDKETLKLTSKVDDRFEQLGDFLFLKGINVPIPQDLVTHILDATYNKESSYKLDSLINFWKWSVLNPNKKAINDLFHWFKTGKFSITDDGMVIAYRNVDIKNKGNNYELSNIVNESYVKIKGQKKSPKNYNIYKSLENDTYYCKKSSMEDDNYEDIGNLNDLYENLNNDSNVVYTDNYTGTMNIVINEPVSMPRSECNEDSEVQCSTGLHFMSKRYGLRLGSVTLTILVNPMNIVAFPSYDQTKGRCCEYLPVGLSTYDEDGLVELDSGSYSIEYSKYCLNELTKLLAERGIDELKDNNLLSEDIQITDINNCIKTLTNYVENKVITFE